MVLMAWCGLRQREAFIEADLQFHLQLAAATKNSVLRSAMDITQHILRREQIRGLENPEQLRKSVQLHRDILDGLQRRDLASTVTAVREHMDYMRELFGDSSQERR